MHRGLRSLVYVLTAFAAGSTVASAQEDEPTGPPPKPLGTVEGFGDWVTAVAYSPDGRTLAAGTYDAVRLFDATSRKEVGTLKTRNGYARGLTFSPGGDRLAVGDYQGLSIWDVAAGRRVRKLAGHTGYVTSLVWTGGGLVSGSEDGTVRVWDADAGTAARTIDIGDPVQGIAVSPDGSSLAVAAGDPTRPTKPGRVALYDLRTGEKAAELVGHERAALAVAFGAGGTRLASVGEDEKANLYDVPGRKPLGFYAGHGRSVNAVAFLADGAITATVSGGNAVGKNELRLWRPDGETLAAIEPHEQRLLALAVAPNGTTLAVGSRDGTVSLWDVSLTVAAATRREPVEARKP